MGVSLPTASEGFYALKWRGRQSEWAKSGGQSMSSKFRLQCAKGGQKYIREVRKWSWTFFGMMSPSCIGS